MNQEIHVYEQVAQYMRYQYPTIPFHFDLSGLWTPSHKQRNLYGRLNKRAWPDLCIAKASRQSSDPTIKSYAGLYLEIKRDGAELYKKDGTLRANIHHAEQASVLEELRMHGYKAEFAIGFDECKAIIDEYLTGVKPKPKVVAPTVRLSHDTLVF